MVKTIYLGLSKAGYIVSIGNSHVAGGAEIARFTDGVLQRRALVAHLRWLSADQLDPEIVLSFSPRALKGRQLESWHALYACLRAWGCSIEGATDA